MSFISRKLLSKCLSGNYFKTNLRFNHFLSQSRTYSNGAYEGDGKTKVNILNKEFELGLMINSFSQHGFRLNNDMNIIGPMAIFPRCVLSWNVGSHENINEHSLSLFYLLEPKVDVLVIGIGDELVTPTFSRKIIDFMKKYRINVEVLNTEQACATFNFLNAESRIVAAALIPPRFIRLNENDLMIAARPQIEKFSLT